MQTRSNGRRRTTWQPASYKIGAKAKIAVSLSALALSAALLNPNTVLADDRLSAKVLVLHGAPGDVVVAFQGAYVGAPQPADPGVAPLESTTPVARDGKPTELFVPIGMTSALWIWDQDSGYHLLGNVTPGENPDPIEVDASLVSAQADRPSNQPVSSAPADPQPPLPRNEHTTKVLVHNGLSGQVVSVFEGPYASEDSMGAMDPGISSLLSTMPVARDGKPTELFVPVGKSSSVWIWEESKGYRFLGNVNPGQRAFPIHLDTSG
jgi:hypothetical protein